MSFFQNVKALYGRAKLIVRAKFRSDADLKKQLAEAGHGVSLTGKDMVLVSMANESFKEVYPKPNSKTFCNGISIPTALTSLTSSMSYGASVLLGIWFFVSAFYGLSHVFAGDVALMTYLSGFATNLAAAGSAYGLGSFMRKMDRDLTMNLCLEEAQRTKDQSPLIYHERALQIETAQVSLQKQNDIKVHKARRDRWQREADTFHYMIADLKKVKGGDEATKLASIASLDRQREDLLGKCAQVDQQIVEIEAEAEKITEDLKVKHILARAISAADTIEGLKSGAIELEIGRIGDDAKGHLAMIAESTKNRRDEILLQIGIDGEVSDRVLQIESDSKPLQIEAGPKDEDDNKPFVIIE